MSMTQSYPKRTLQWPQRRLEYRSSVHAVSYIYVLLQRRSKAYDSLLDVHHLCCPVSNFRLNHRLIQPVSNALVEKGHSGRPYEGCIQMSGVSSGEYI